MLLSNEQCWSLISQLLEQHPGLLPEVEAHAEDLLSEIVGEWVGEDVFRAVLEGPTIRRSVLPFFEQMRTLLDLGFLQPASEVCLGIVSGLYRVRLETSQLGEPYLLEAAQDAVQELRDWRRSVEPPERLWELIPDWSDELSS